MIPIANITVATNSDIPQIVSLVNSAFRGDTSKKGWTTEADLLIGPQRTDEASVLEMFLKPDAVILKHTEPDGSISGCVYLEKQENRIYLGMLTVSPEIQAKGIGKLLMEAAETHAQAMGCNAIIMTVISVRTELIAWYERKGYYDTGIKKPFPVNELFGKPTQKLEFIQLQKDI
ncbi:GNAT family N-acetyltransferase [Limnovirga soli]|uniref:GNAT family N-acetyltransferase n=1 Tax=Limnovirga soli TaxID=2656915 RepID=A0A8J8FID8_9BACT|nr:GNAT family N-acetyltransferase [Limnovirga soli]NNV55629.1 GNAT family N-acetyltransferase [Limnovirga soli]